MDQESAIQVEIRGTELGQKSNSASFPDGLTAAADSPLKNRRFPKTDLRYWQKVVYRRTYKHAGQRFEINHYSARIQHLGKQVIFSLGTPNRVAAATKARTIFLYLSANGWLATLAKFKPRREHSAPDAVVTIGELITAVLANSTAHKRTVTDYARSLRRISANIFGIEGGKRRFDYRNGGRDEWRKQIDAIRLEKLTRDRIQTWKHEFLVRAGSDPRKVRSARISVNSMIRQARTLFAPKHIESVILPTGFKCPFDDVKFEPRQSMRYQSEFDLAQVLAQALKELSNEAEVLKTILLAAMAGLRRGEIDKLEWSSFSWERATLRITPTAHFRPKSQDSIGEVDLDPELVTVFKTFEALRTGPFVIESSVPAKVDATYSHYRCELIFRRVTAWLRAHGVSGRSPLHTLRKEYGSIICDFHGIYAASQALRHHDIAITQQHYIDKKQRVTPGLGHVLSGNARMFGGTHDGKQKGPLR